MSKTIFGSLIVLATLALAPPLWAQTLTQGVWSGSITLPDGTAEELVFQVSVADDGEVTIVMGEDDAEVQLRDIGFEEGNLQFSWATGEQIIRCSLAPRDDGSYAGTCEDPGGPLGEVTMTPPGG